jgi:hypothetical protein
VTDEDRKIYRGVLSIYAKLLPIMQAYQKNAKQPDPQAGFDFIAEERNRKIMEDLLEDLEHTSAVARKYNTMSLKFEGKNDINFSITATYAPGGKYYDTCVPTELNHEYLLQLIDQGCNGSIEFTKREGYLAHSLQPANKWAMVPVMHSKLLDMRRFTAFARSFLSKN